MREGEVKEALTAGECRCRWKSPDSMKCGMPGMRINCEPLWDCGVDISRALRNFHKLLERLEFAPHLCFHLNDHAIVTKILAHNFALLGTYTKIRQPELVLLFAVNRTLYWLCAGGLILPTVRRSAQFHCCGPLMEISSGNSPATPIPQGWSSEPSGH